MLGDLASWKALPGVGINAFGVAHKGIDCAGGVVGGGFDVLDCRGDLRDAWVSGG